MLYIHIYNIYNVYTLYNIYTYIHIKYKVIKTYVKAQKCGKHKYLSLKCT